MAASPFEKMPLEAMLDRHKQENSAVPLNIPEHRLPPKSSAETLESRVARGDYSAVNAALKAFANSLAVWGTSLSQLPTVPMGTPEGDALKNLRDNVLPELERLAVSAKDATKKLL